MEQPAESLTRHERRQLKKQQREQEQQQKEKTQTAKQKRKSMITWSIVTIVVLGIVIFFMMLPKNATPQPQQPYSKGQVHWHASLKVFLCGEEKLMPAPIGESHLGLPLLHTHADRRVHIEGTVWRSEDILLGKYMEVIGQNFKDDELLEKKNGDVCNGTPGKVKLFANGEENSLLTKYVIKDGDKYGLRFEP